MSYTAEMRASYDQSEERDRLDAQAPATVGAVGSGLSFAVSRWT